MEENNELKNPENVESSNNIDSNNNQPQKSPKAKKIIAGVACVVVVAGVITGVALSRTKLFTKNDSSNNNTTSSNNSTEQNNTIERKASKKIDESKPWVYDAEYGKDKSVKKLHNSDSNKDLVVPFININSTAGKKANTEIERLYNEIYEKYATDITESVKNFSRIEYKFYENNNILSIVIENSNGGIPGGAGRCPLYIYNFNLDTLENATNEELAKQTGYNSITEVTEIVNKWISKEKESEDGASSIVGLVKDTYFIDSNNRLNFVYTVAAAGTYDIAKVVDEAKETQSNDNSKLNKVTDVIANQIDYKYMIVEGKDSNGNTVWKYTTPEENHPLNIVNEGQKLIGTRKGKVYLCDWGKLYILDEQTGNVLKKNTEANIGAARAYAFDENDNLYTVSYLSALNKFDSNANLVISTFDVWDNGYTWPNKISISGDSIIIDYGEQGSVIVNKNTLKMNKDKSKDSSKYAEEYIKIIDKVVAEYPNNQITYDLIYFNNDNIPDLVIGVQGYWVSLYIYEDGKIYNPIDGWPYGIGGSKYYDYIEKKGVVYNYGNGFAGAISYNTYYLLNSKREFDEFTIISEGADIEPTDSMYEQVQKELAETAGYYYNGKKISEEEFNNKLKEASVSSNESDYKSLSGNKTVEEIKRQLQ